MTYIVSDGAAQLVHSWSCLGNFLGCADDIRRILQWPFAPVQKMWKISDCFWSGAGSFKMQEQRPSHGAAVCGQRRERNANHGSNSDKQHRNEWICCYCDSHTRKTLAQWGNILFSWRREHERGRLHSSRSLKNWTKNYHHALLWHHHHASSRTGC